MRFKESSDPEQTMTPMAHRTTLRCSVATKNHTVEARLGFVVSHSLPYFSTLQNMNPQPLSPYEQSGSSWYKRHIEVLWILHHFFYQIFLYAPQGYHDAVSCPVLYDIVMSAV